MKTLSKQLISSLIFALLTISSAELLADDAVTTSLSDKERSGGHLKVGFGYKEIHNPYEDTYKDSGKTLFLNARYQWENRLFVEASYYRVLNTGLNLGYNVYNTENWNFDVTTLIGHGPSEVGLYDEDEIFYKKRNITRMVGLRATGSFEQTTMQFVLAPVSLNSEYDNAMYASAWLDHSIQFKNWEFYAAVGLEYRSEDMLDYHYGIPEEVATKNFAAYNPGAGIDITAEVGVSYPISQNWLFETYYRHTELSDSINDSPIIQLASSLKDRSKNMSEFGILVSYVY